MLEFLSSGNVFGLVVGVLVCEALLLGVFVLRSGRGIGLVDLLASVGAGLGLALGALLVLQRAPALAVAASLGLALVAHSVDLFRRWRR